MGALLGGVCYATAADAARVVFSGVGPVAHAGGTVSAPEETAPDVWGMVTRSGTGVVSSVALQAPPFPVCDSVDSVTDGMTLGWGVAGVWVVAWAISVLRKGLQ